jgi:tRNA pseudouridine65 synthase
VTPEATRPETSDGLLKILWRDAWLCAIDKPCGLMVHRSNKGTDTRFALQLLRDQLGQRVWPLHRLDRATSGLLLFALDEATAAAMGQQMMDRRISKRYLAVVRGHIDQAGLIDHPLQADGRGPARTARTEYRCLARMELPFTVGRYPSARYSLIEAMPRTGRMHQIRRHLKHIFHPVIGDTTYGEGRHNRLFRELFVCHRLLLHASNLSFEHPHQAQSIHLTSPLTGSFRRIAGEFIHREFFFTNREDAKHAK